MWFWIISAIAGSILGGATESWFAETKFGIWFYKKVDQIYTWAAKKTKYKDIRERRKVEKEIS